MRKYPEKYLEVLKNEVNIIGNNGVKIIFKPSPGEKRDGYSNFDLVNDPYVSPMMAKSHANLQKAILVGAEFDGLCIQTEFYAK